ncbi:hypothetical protein K523DRAFT_86954 [Schizophyllum commune Tattone D]|nr:hypothetical protein K523DRAFT_86954 [Schizophyllum commune Tattone D]
MERYIRRVQRSLKWGEEDASANLSRKARCWATWSRISTGKSASLDNERLSVSCCACSWCMRVGTKTRCWDHRRSPWVLCASG